MFFLNAWLNLPFSIRFNKIITHVSLQVVGRLHILSVLFSAFARLQIHGLVRVHYQRVSWVINRGTAILSRRLKSVTWASSTLSTSSGTSFLPWRPQSCCAFLVLELLIILSMSMMALLAWLIPLPTSGRIVLSYIQRRKVWATEPIKERRVAPTPTCTLTHQAHRRGLTSMMPKLTHWRCQSWRRSPHHPLRSTSSSLLSWWSSVLR